MCTTPYYPNNIPKMFHVKSCSDHGRLLTHIRSLHAETTSVAESESGVTAVETLVSQKGNDFSGVTSSDVRLTTETKH